MKSEEAAVTAVRFEIKIHDADFARLSAINFETESDIVYRAQISLTARRASL